MYSANDEAIVFIVSRIQHAMDIMAVIAGIWFGLIVLWLFAMILYRSFWKED